MTLLEEIEELLAALGADMPDLSAVRFDAAENRALTPISGFRMRASPSRNPHVQGKPPQG